MKISIERIINMNYVRYDRLSSIISEAFKGSRATSVNIYIDMYSIIKSLYSNNYIIENYSIITSCIINMCAHYRAFFDKLNVSTKFYIVQSDNCNEFNKTYYQGYNSKNEELFKANEVLHGMIDNNYKLLEILCPYLPDIFFIKGTFETGVIMYDIMCRQEADGDKSPNIVITKDLYNFQLVGIRPDTIILRPKKNNGQDESYYIDSNNLINIYLMDRRAEPYVNTINAGLFSLIMALTRVPERNVKSMIRISVVKEIQRCINEYKINNSYNSNIEFAYNNLNISDTVAIETLQFRFNAVDIISQHFTAVNTSEFRLFTFPNYYDPENVKAINNAYFKDNPLDLNRL